MSTSSTSSPILHASRSLKILIVGGGVTGPALAFWLTRAGHRVVIAERFDALRASGAQVDLRGQGIDAITRMGLLNPVRAELVAEPGVALVDSRGRRRATIMANTSGRGRQSLTSEYEIMRGDLVRILFEATKQAAEYRFGLTVDGFEQHPDGGAGSSGVTAHFSDGTGEDFDLLVGADGQGSRIRTALLPASSPDPYRRLGIHTAYWFVPRTPSDTDVRDSYIAPGGRMIMRRSHTPHDTQAYFTLRETSPQASAVHRQPLAEQKRFWADKFADAGWQAQRFIDGMSDTPNFYSQEVLQVRTDTWSKGRVVLAGDAAHCASPYSGMGISGGLVGAYVLAGEINARAADLPTALRRYQTTMAPFVENIQAAVNPRLLRLSMPTTRTAAAALVSATSVAAALHIPDLIAKTSSTDRGGDWQLPTYT